jgi:hypothetical protein
MNQPSDDSSSALLTEGQRDCAQCGSSQLFRVLATRLESRGLVSRVVTYPGGAHDDKHVEEIVVVNPAARERGEIRIGDDGSVTWEYVGRLDDDGVRAIVDEATNALRSPGVLLRRIRP